MMKEQNRNTDELERLSRLADYEVSDKDPDIRGWSLVGADRKHVGEIKDLIVNLSTMDVRYLDVEPTLKMVSSQKRFLVPIDSVSLDRETEQVIIPDMDSDELNACPCYEEEVISSDYEQTVDRYFSPRNGNASRIISESKQDEILEDNRP